MSLLGLSDFAGLRVNTTDSIARGLYLTRSWPLTRGAYVMVCPPAQPIFTMAEVRGYLAAGFCPSGTQPLMKQVAAVPGDQVTIASTGVWVNGRHLGASTPYRMDGANRPLPQLQLKTTVKPGQLLLMTDHNPWSFDGRYFGLMTPEHLQVLQPLWTFN